MGSLKLISLTNIILLVAFNAFAASPESFVPKIDFLKGWKGGATKESLRYCQNASGRLDEKSFTVKIEDTFNRWDAAVKRKDKPETVRQLGFEVMILKTCYLKRFQPNSPETSYSLAVIGEFWIAMHKLFSANCDKKISAGFLNEAQWCYAEALGLLPGDSRHNGFRSKIVERMKEITNSLK